MTVDSLPYTKGPETRPLVESNPPKVTRMGLRWTLITLTVGIKIYPLTLLKYLFHEIIADVNFAQYLHVSECLNR